MQMCEAKQRGEANKSINGKMQSVMILYQHKWNYEIDLTYCTYY